MPAYGVPAYGAMPAGYSYGAMPTAGMDARFSPYGVPAYGVAMPGYAPAATTGLPPGWEQVTDPTSGKPYYCNRSTGETSWTPPAGAAAPAAAPAAAAAAASAAAAVPTA